MKPYYDVVRAVRASVPPKLKRLTPAVHVTALCIYCQYLITEWFPLSGYNGNDTTESGDIDGE